jgi:hypothetical protein
MTDIPSRLVRIEEQTKYIKETVDELSILFKDQARNYHDTDIKLAQFEVKIEGISAKLETLETKLDGGTTPPKQFGRATVAAATTFVLSIIAAVFEYFKK